LFFFAIKGKTAGKGIVVLFVFFLGLFFGSTLGLAHRWIGLLGVSVVGYFLFEGHERGAETLRRGVGLES